MSAYHQRVRAVEARYKSTRCWHAQRKRAALRRACVAAWKRPGHKSQVMIAAELGVAQSTVGVLLRAAGIYCGRGRNNVATPRLQGGRGFKSETPDLLRAAAEELSAREKIFWGDRKAIALEFGVPYNSLLEKVLQLRSSRESKRSAA